MEAMMNLLLMAVLFVAGLVNFFIYFPTKRISAWFQSLSLEQKPLQRAVATTATATPAAAESGKGMTAAAAGEKKGRLKKVFGTFDRNNDGYITKKELEESLRNIRISMTKREVDEMFREVDENGDGLIDFEEFCVLGERLMGGDEQERERGEEEEEEELREAFGVFDKDRDGLISVDELSLVLSCLGLKEGKKVEDCKEMIRKVDMDGDGMVNFDEFKRMMRNGGALILAQS